MTLNLPNPNPKCSCFLHFIFTRETENLSRPAVLSLNKSPPEVEIPTRPAKLQLESNYRFGKFFSKTCTMPAKLETFVPLSSKNTNNKNVSLQRKQQ